MKHKFSNSFNLPDYLEEALAPLSWSSVFSEKFRTDIILCITADSKKEVIGDFITSIQTVKFLDQIWVNKLCSALVKFASDSDK